MSEILAIQARKILDSEETLQSRQRFIWKAACAAGRQCRPELPPAPGKPWNCVIRMRAVMVARGS